MDQQDNSTSRAIDGANGDEELSFQVILQSSAGTERVIARAASAQLAQAIFKAATAEYPGERLRLSHDGRTVAESGKD